MRPEIPRIAILLESSTSWGAEALSGIAAFIRQHRPWHIFVEPHGWYERLRLPKGWKGDGVIGRVTSPAMCAELRRARVPVVNLGYIPFRERRFVQVTSDETLIARMAADHLLGQGFVNVAYCGPPWYPHYSDRIGSSFFAAITAAGLRCHQQPRAASPRRGWAARQAALAAWLATLPRPLAIFTWNAERGREVIDACLSVRLRVPEDVAVLAGDNDAPTCELALPPLSSIDHGASRIGFAAARRLERMLLGDREGGEAEFFAPRAVIVRQSSDMIAIDDPKIATAVRFLRDHFREPIRVDDVVRAVGISRRLFEARFVHHVRRTPARELRSLRLRHAQKLLVDTDDKLDRVAGLSGFGCAEIMSRTFRRELGVTPAGFRVRSRQG